MTWHGNVGKQWEKRPRQKGNLAIEAMLVLRIDGSARAAYHRHFLALAYAASDVAPNRWGD